MNVAFICDKNYLIPTKASINSIIKNKRKDDEIKIYVIGVELEKADFSDFEAFQSEKIQIKIIIPPPAFEQITIKHLYVSKAALYKMILADLLTDVDRVIYIDSDMLILKSLRPLFDVELNNAYAAVVRDMIGERTHHLPEALGVEHYFNSGMMLLNLAKIRRDDAVQKLIREREGDDCNHYMDQHVFNRVFNKNLVFLLPEFNYMQTINVFSLQERADFFGVSTDEMKMIAQRPTILHLTNRYKPWNSGKAEQMDLWFSYLPELDRRTIISDLIKRETKRADDLQEQLNRTRAKLQKSKDVFAFMMAQYADDYQCREDKICLEFGKRESSEIERWVIKHEHILYDCLKNEKRPMIIYGAGQVGRAVFQCLKKLNLENRVQGFAVSDLQTNLPELFHKRVDLLKNYDNQLSLVLIAIKARTEDCANIKEIRKLLERDGFKNFIDINQLFYS